MTPETVDFLNHLTTQVVLAIACIVLYRDLQGKFTHVNEENARNLAGLTKSMQTMAAQVQTIAQTVKTVQVDLVELVKLQADQHKSQSNKNWDNSAVG